MILWAPVFRRNRVNKPARVPHRLEVYAPVLGARTPLSGRSVTSEAWLWAALTAQDAEPQTADPCEPENPYDSPPGSGISMPAYYKPTPSVKDRNNFFP